MAKRPDRVAQISQLAEPGIRLLFLGDCALTLDLPEENADRVLGLAAALDERIAAGDFAGASETVPALRSVTLHFDPLAADPDSWLDDLMALAARTPSKRPDPRAFTLPVCFDAEFAPDLAEISTKPADFIEALTAQAVTVKMLGFLPGFAYMGDIPEACRAPRRKTPRSSRPARSRSRARCAPPIPGPVPAAGI